MFNGVAGSSKVMSGEHRASNGLDPIDVFKRAGLSLLWRVAIFFAPCLVGYTVGSIIAQPEYFPAPDEFLSVNPFLMILHVVMFPALWGMLMWVSCVSVVGMVAIPFYVAYLFLIFYTDVELKLPFAGITVVQIYVTYITLGNVTWLGLLMTGHATALAVALPVWLWMRPRLSPLSIKEDKTRPEGIELYRHRWGLTDGQVKRCEAYLRFLRDLREKREG
jgi:hypothetical protein